MNIIAFDTAADVFSLALGAGEKTYCLEIDGGQKHSELIMDGAETLVQFAGIAKAELDAVCCMEGPGSFTGLRIGFAAAKGLALALDIPLIPVPTLDCMALPFPFWPGPVLPVIDAKKNAFFASFYRNGERLTEYLDAGAEELAAATGRIILGEAAVSGAKDLAGSPNHAAVSGAGGCGVLLTGPGAAMLFPALSAALDAFSADRGNPVKLVVDPAYRRGRALELLNLAEKTGILNTADGGGTGRRIPAEYAGPLYLRKSDAELNG